MGSPKKKVKKRDCQNNLYDPSTIMDPAHYRRTNNLVDPKLSETFMCINYSRRNLQLYWLLEANERCNGRTELASGAENSIKPMRERRTASSNHCSISQEICILFLIEILTCHGHIENIFFH